MKTNCTEAVGFLFEGISVFNHLKKEYFSASKNSE
jgi:hypothetical protein